MGIADGCHAQNRDADGSDDEADHCRDRIAPGKLAEMHREDQVSRAKEHPEQRSCHQDPLLHVEPFLHGTSLLLMTLILPLYLKSEKRLFIISI